MQHTEIINPINIIDNHNRIERININDYVDNRNIEANNRLNTDNTINQNINEYNPLIYDPQNVHDSFVNNTISNSINNINNKEYCSNLKFNDIIDIINKKINEDKFEYKLLMRNSFDEE